MERTSGGEEAQAVGRDKRVALGLTECGIGQHDAREADEHESERPNHAGISGVTVRVRSAS